MKPNFFLNPDLFLQELERRAVEEGYLKPDPALPALAQRVMAAPDVVDVKSAAAGEAVEARRDARESKPLTDADIPDPADDWEDGPKDL
jgi:hypothetical protein